MDKNDIIALLERIKYRYITYADYELYDEEQMNFIMRIFEDIEDEVNYNFE